MSTTDSLVYHYPLFSLEEPSGFVDATTVQLILDTDSDYLPNVSFMYFPLPDPDMTLDAYVQLQLESMDRDSAMADLTVGTITELTVNGDPAREIPMEFSLPLHTSGDGPSVALAMRGSQIHILRHGVAFMVTLTAQSDGFDQVRERFGRLMASLRFRA